MYLSAINGYFCQDTNGLVHLYGTVSYKDGDTVTRVDLTPDAKGSYWADPNTGEQVRIGIASPLTDQSFLESARVGKEAGTKGERFGERTVEMVDSVDHLLSFRAVCDPNGRLRVLGNVRTLPKGFARWQP